MPMKNLSGMPLFFVIICFIFSGAVLVSVAYARYNGIDVDYKGAIIMFLAPICIAWAISGWHGDIK